MKRVGVVPKGGGLRFFLLPMIDREPISNTKPDYRACEGRGNNQMESSTSPDIQNYILKDH